MVGNSYVVLFFVFLSARESSFYFRTNTLPQLDTDHNLEPGRTQLLHELKLSPTNIEKGRDYVFPVTSLTCILSFPQTSSHLCVI